MYQIDFGDRTENQCIALGILSTGAFFDEYTVLQSKIGGLEDMAFVAKCKSEEVKILQIDYYVHPHSTFTFNPFSFSCKWSKNLQSSNS